MGNKNSESYGVKIQKIADTLQVICIILIVVTGLVFMAAGTRATLFAILYIALGIIVVTIIHAFLKGFGELVEDTRCIRRSNASLAEFYDELKRKRQGE